MSEYQYCEFRAIDRPLDQNERDKLRTLSTRAEITATSLTNTYQWGSFKGDPAKLMDLYFDAFVYVSNWGTYRLMFRIPRRFIDVETVSAYCDDETLSMTVSKNHVVLEFCINQEAPDDWVEGEGLMAALISLRSDLMRGDLRALYLGWLASIRADGWDDDGQFEPPVPPGLAKLSAPLRALVEFICVDDELIQVAASASSGEPPAEPSPIEFAGWIKGLTASEKDAYLLRFVTDEGDIPLRAELSRRFRESTLPKATKPVPASKRRTAAELLVAYDTLLEEKRQKAAERAVKETARRDREQAEARAKLLDNLARRESSVWGEVDELIAMKRPKEYDRAIDLLSDLHELAARSGREAEAQARIHELRRKHQSKSSFLSRLDAKGLGT